MRRENSRQSISLPSAALEIIEIDVIDGGNGGWDDDRCNQIRHQRSGVRRRVRAKNINLPWTWLLKSLKLMSSTVIMVKILGGTVIDAAIR